MMGDVLKVRKKPVVVEAMEYVHRKPQDAAPHLRWIRDGGGTATFDPLSGDIVITTLEGPMHAPSGWWIIKGVQGEFYGCKPDIFYQTYEVVSSGGIS